MDIVRNYMERLRDLHDKSFKIALVIEVDHLSEIENLHIYHDDGYGNGDQILSMAMTDVVAGLKRYLYSLGLYYIA